MRRRHSENTDKENYKKAMTDTIRKYGRQGKEKEDLEGDTQTREQNIRNEMRGK
jgi:hypothetical protein